MSNDASPPPTDEEAQKAKLKEVLRHRMLVKKLDIRTPGDPDGYTPATRGGCWICCRADLRGMTFDYEWDTNVHVECIRQWLSVYPDDPEVSLMSYLLPENRKLGFWAKLFGGLACKVKGTHRRLMTETWSSDEVKASSCLRCGLPGYTKTPGPNESF